MARPTKSGPQLSGLADPSSGFATGLRSIAAAHPAPASESFYRALIEQTSDLVSVLAADGAILYASPSHRWILGYEPEDLQGRNAFELVHADDLPALRERFRVACTTTGQTTSNQYHYRHADGSWRTIEAVGTNLFDDPSVAGLVVNARDVTDRVRAEEALAKQSVLLANQLAELDRLYRTAPVGLGFVDCDLRYVRINDTLAAMNGWPPAAHIGRTPQETLPELAGTLLPICRRVIETGEPAVMEVHGTTPAAPGVEKDWLINYHRLEDRDGRPLGLSAVVQEITELKDAERALERARLELERRVRERTAALVNANEALRAEIAERARAEEFLRQSEERYRRLVENINEVIFTVDPGGRITYVSPSIERLTGGRAVAEVIGHSFLEFVHPDDAPALIESFQHLLGGRPEPSEYRVFGKDGAVYWLRSQSQTVVEDGRVVAVQGVLTDITARRRAEMEARQQREELAHVQRLTTAGEMTAEIAHQINQPLGAIVNFAGGLAARLRDGKVQPDAMREVADRIAEEAQRASEVIRRLRAFLRKGESVVRDCELNHLVSRVCSLIEEDFRREAIDVRLLLAPRLPSLYLDAVLIEQVILNLLRNALEALAGSGVGPRRVEIATRLADQTVHVTVADTGIGLPAGSEGKIFEAFFTTKPGGLGLGLSVSRSIIEANGGRLWAERNPNGGTTIAFALPRTAPLRS